MGAAETIAERRERARVRRPGRERDLMVEEGIFGGIGGWMDELMGGWREGILIG